MSDEYCVIAVLAIMPVFNIEMMLKFCDPKRRTDGGKSHIGEDS